MSTQMNLRFLANHPYDGPTYDRIREMVEDKNVELRAVVDGLIADAVFQAEKRELLEAALIEIGDIVKGAI